MILTLRAYLRATLRSAANFALRKANFALRKAYFALRNAIRG